MRLMVDSFWRAAVYCLHPRVILWSLVPLLISGMLAALLGYFFWDIALAALRLQLESWSWSAWLMGWLVGVGGEGIGQLVVPLLLAALTLPLLVIVALLVVALLMMPHLVDLVAQRRFPLLERRHGEPLWRSVAGSIGATLAALLALLLSMPLWLIPPLVLILPPLIWGWLTYRVMGVDALAEHASRDERVRVMREHRWPLLGIGIVTGYLGAAPALVWAVSAAWLVLAPLLIAVSMWLYTLVFAFSALWFIHYALAALADLRGVLPADAPRHGATVVEARP